MSNKQKRGANKPKRWDAESVLCEYCQAVAVRDDAAAVISFAALVAAADDAFLLHTIVKASKRLRGQHELSMTEERALDKLFQTPEMKRALDQNKNESEAVAYAWLRYSYRDAQSAQQDPARPADTTATTPSADVSPGEDIEATALKELEDENAKLRAANEGLEREKTAAGRRITKLESEKAENEKRINQLNRDLQKSQDEAKRDAERFSQKLEQSQRETTNLRAGLERRINELTEQLELISLEIERQRKSSEQEIDDILSELDAEKKETERLLAASKESEGLQADLTAARKRIKQLQEKQESIRRDAGRDKLTAILELAGRAINDLMLYPDKMRSGALDEDALVGFEVAIDDLIDAFVQSGAKQIGRQGETTAFDSSIYECSSSVGNGTEVVVKAVGFSVDGNTVIPARVDQIEKKGEE